MRVHQYALVVATCVALATGVGACRDDGGGSRSGETADTRPGDTDEDASGGSDTVPTDSGPETRDAAERDSALLDAEDEPDTAEDGTVLDGDATGDASNPDAGGCCTYVAGNPWMCRYELPSGGTPDRRVTSRDELHRAVDNAAPGETISIEGRTYEMQKTLRLFNSGESGNRIVLAGEPGAKVVLDFSAVDGNGLLIRSAYWRLRNFVVHGAGNNGIKGKGRDGDGGSTTHHLTLENLEVRQNERNGIQLTRNTHDNVVRQTMSHDNGTTDNGDGIALPSAKEDTGPQNQDNLVECVSVWRNTDDGIDLFTDKNTDVLYSMAWKNGFDSQGNPVGDGNGYKLGGENDSRPYRSGGGLVLGNIAFDNRNRGFNYNNATIPLEVYHNTAFGNGGRGYRFGRTDHVLKNNIGYDNSGNAIGDEVVDDNNSWNLGIDDPQYVSTSRTSSDFLLLPADSPAVDAGVSLSVSWPVVGAAPDLGASERGASPPTCISGC